MEKFAINYADVKTQLLSQKKRKYRLADVKHRLQKVAFDVVRFVDSDKLDDLWRVEKDGDDEYIVAMYDQEMVAEASTEVKSGWNALPDKVGNIHVFYNDSPIKKIALASFNISEDNAQSTCSLIKDKLASSPSFLNSFLNELNESEREALAEVNPTILAGK